MRHKDLPIDAFADMLSDMLREGERRHRALRDAADRLHAVASDVKVNIRHLEAGATEAMRALDAPPDDGMICRNRCDRSPNRWATRRTRRRE